MEKRKAGVVFIHPDLGIGGAERLVLDVAVALSKQHNKVSFMTNHFNKNHAFQELRENQFPVEVIGDWIPRNICGLCQAFFAYIRMMYLVLIHIFFNNKSKPDLYFVDQIPIAVPFVKWTGAKVIYYCHHPDLLASVPGGLLKRLYRFPINWLESQGTGMADIILVNSKYTATVFHETFPSIHRDVQILYPTISSLYQETIMNGGLTPLGNILPELQHVQGSFIFLSINRFHPAKNLELALEGLDLLRNKLCKDKWDQLHLIIAGGYDPNSVLNAVYFSKLVKLCEKKNLSSKVTFLKSPSDGIKADLLLNCNCLVYTPINEHFGIVPLEAMAASKPVIACNNGGPCETLLDKVTGYLCDPTPDGMSDGFLKIINNIELDEMGHAGRKRLEQYFSYETFCSRVNEVVENVIYGNIKLTTLEKIVKVMETVIPEPEYKDVYEDITSSPSSTAYLSTTISSSETHTSEIETSLESI
ncbi:hypothetical protein FQA39_LY14572 [Lamprigera yunnana]|nr:hypothetical protein FQA39_LY14572 [Lamprigera yunnana]